MFFAGVVIDSLRIDRLEKKWAARCLFLLVIAISICSNLWPVGDPDFSKFTTWTESFSNTSEMYAAILSSNDIALKIISIGNIIYCLFFVAVLFVYVFIAILYSRIYVGEKSGQKLGQSCLAFLRYLPILIVFYIMVSIPVILLNWIGLILLIFVVPALFFSPILITLEKKNPIAALIYSYRYTKGVKFSIAWNLMTLYFMYQAAEWLFFGFLPTASNAVVLLHGFFTAFFVLAFGRMTGIFYDRLHIHPVPPVTAPLN